MAQAGRPSPPAGRRASIPLRRAKSTSKRRRAQPSSASQLAPAGRPAPAALRRGSRRDRPRRSARGLAANACLVGRDPVDRGIGEAGQRHCARIDLVADRIPFRRDRLGERFGRHDQQPCAPGSAAACHRARRPNRSSPLDRSACFQKRFTVARSCCSQSFLSSRGAKTASIVPTIATIAPTAASRRPAAGRCRRWRARGRRSPARPAGPA